ncbi:cytochrome ubiquinol oxidase subunit I [Ramlibacter sp. G-1-2-2]|uniref:Cytochrome ubiquinol oxidase subunit I n=1 Tax=Ramlibacter agri TaxID=2728837 RepID=A0A848HA17_9BURK|nr:cytochrome ubiquinol oxidase subunit I [Ramlibacter agri]NML46290.1 cytochrome ubiquinol oxidase subunit I [Ramlibacter agri]
MDTLMLSRLQFAANIGFHILFPAINIALSWFLVYFRVRNSRAANQDEARQWEEAYYLWTKVFALTFAIGVVTGLTMSFQFGTNWPGYMEKVGNIAGPLLGYEVLTAFFLEATFLGIMLFGRTRVSGRVHLTATLMVAAGTTLSAFWILSLNSWMQTPQGHSFANGQYFAEDWLAIIFNPSFPYRLAHMVLASVLTAAFLVAGLSAWQMLCGTANGGTRRALRAGVVTAAVAIPIQIFAGDAHGLNTLEHQPAKIAAIEAIWHTETSAPLTLIGWPNEKEGRTDFAIQVPRLASIILAHDPNATLKGLDQFPDAHPPVLPVFWGFRVMVGMGLLMLAVSWSSAWSLWRQRPFARWQLRLQAGMTFAGWVATIAGWTVTEVGRQPFLVYGLLRTADAVAPHPPGVVLSTLIAYLALYAFLLVAYVLVLMYMSEHPAMPTAQSPQSPKAALPVGGSA